MSGVLLWVVSPKENANSLLSLMPRIGSPRRSKLCSRLTFSTGVLAYSGAVAHPIRSSEEMVYEVVLKQAALVREQSRVKERALDLDERIETDGLSNWDLLNQAYDRCGEVCAEYAKTFYLGTLLMTPERRRAVWAIYGNNFAGSIAIANFTNLSKASLSRIKASLSKARRKSQFFVSGF